MKQTNPLSAFFAWLGNSDAKKLKAKVPTASDGDGEYKSSTSSTTAFAERLKKPPPKSVAKASSVFSKFTLSKFPAKSMPSNYVHSAKSPAAVQHVQRQMITQQIERVNNAETPNRGMKLALPKETLRKLLPSFDAEAATIELDDVLKLIEQKMNGTEFYANGNPTLNRLALQSRVQEIMASVKQAKGVAVLPPSDDVFDGPEE